jgi:hypothetical protein
MQIEDPKKRGSVSKRTPYEKEVVYGKTNVPAGS